MGGPVAVTLTTHAQDIERHALKLYEGCPRTNSVSFLYICRLRRVIAVSSVRFAISQPLKRNLEDTEETATTPI